MLANHPNYLIKVSQTLLLKVKLDQSPEAERHTLEQISMPDFQQHLQTENEKKAFWINIYNVYFQILSNSKNATMKSIYTDKSILIAQHWFSLDAIEHGILRKFRWKYSLGYLPNPFVGSLIKKLALKTIDYRIHFALNCGAKSCPPIAFYFADTLDRELDKAMQNFITSETSVDLHKKKIYTSKLSGFSPKI